MRSQNQIILIGLGLLIHLLPIVSGNNYYSLGGANLKFGGYVNPPYDALVRQPDGNYTVVGPNMNVVQWLSQRLNFSITVVPVNDEAIIAKVGLFEAGFSKIINKGPPPQRPKVFIAQELSWCLIISPDRAERMDYTFMVWMEPFTLLRPIPQYESRLFAFIRPFQPVVWLFLAISISFFVGFLSAFSWHYKSENAVVSNDKDRTKSIPYSHIKNYPTSVSYYAVYVVNVLTNHGSYSPYSKYSFRVLAGSWLLASLVLVNSYSSIVVSSLTVPVLKSTVDALEDLVNNDEVSLIMQKNVVLGNQILSAKSGLFKVLGDQLREHPDRILMDFPSIFKKLEEGKYVFPFMNSYNRYFIANRFKKDRQCRFQLSHPLQYSTGSFSLVLQKHSKYTSSLTNGLITLWETGLSPFWIKNITNYAAEKCFDKNQMEAKKSVNPQVPIKLGDLLSAFFILGAGIGLSIASFILELVSGKFIRLKRQ